MKVESIFLSFFLAILAEDDLTQEDYEELERRNLKVADPVKIHYEMGDFNSEYEFLIQALKFNEINRSNISIDYDLTTPENKKLIREKIERIINAGNYNGT